MNKIMTSSSMQDLLGIICSVFDAYSAVLVLPADGDRFCIQYSFSLGEGVQQGACISSGQGLVGWILHHKRPLLINNFDRKRSHLGYYSGQEERKVKAFMGCSLPEGGALCIDSRRSYSFSDKDQKILDLFSRLTMQIMADKQVNFEARAGRRYYYGLQNIQKLRKSNAKWSGFLNSFLSIISHASCFSHALFVARADKGEDFFIEGCLGSGFFKNEEDINSSFPLKHGLTGWVFNNGQPVFKGAESSLSGQSLLGRKVSVSSLQSLMLLPVMIGNTPRGVIILGDSESTVIDDELKNFVLAAVDYLSLFLENLYQKSYISHMS